jgi:hypothetical protein
VTTGARKRRTPPATNSATLTISAATGATVDVEFMAHTELLPVLLREFFVRVVPSWFRPIFIQFVRLR